MRAIALVATWWGPPPPWFDFWLLAASRQGQADVLLFADQVEDRGTPNVRIVAMTFADFVRGCGERIGVEVPALHLSKLYDLRPTFGESLATWLEGYECWGYMDMDCLLGDLALLSPGDGCQYDAYLVSERSPMGFLSVFRNTPAINGLWRRGHDVERYLQRDIGAPLDEMWFGKTLDRAGVNQHRRHLYAWPKRKERGLALYDDGHAFWQGAEVACLHFGGLNGWRSAWQRFAFDPDVRRFRISPHGMESF